MREAARRMKPLPVLLAVLTFIFLTHAATPARAVDLPLAAASPLTGVQFDDKPLILPVQRNFQMAMLTASSELGRSCGNMEAYGWRMSQSEQGRVNQIFNNTTDRLRMLGYTVAPQKLSSVSSDITLFTADNANGHFIFLWSAGELGLVMTLCESTAPVATSYRPAPGVPSVQIFPVPNDVVASRLDSPSRTAMSESDSSFSPLGEWEGGYSCEQGFTGGSIQITHLSGKDFEGVFKFYPTPKNPDMHAGAYSIYGQYDRASHRILINPGKWIERPPHYFNTVIVGGFNPARDSFSGFFQGVSGCTSFEAQRVGKPYPDFGGGHRKPSEHGMMSAPVKKPVKKVIKKIVRKPARKPAPPKAATRHVPLSSIMTPIVPVTAAPVTAPATAQTPAAAPAASAPAKTAVPAAPSADAPPLIDAPAIAPAARPVGDSGITVGSPGK